MKWNKLLTTKRFGMENYYQGNHDGRTEYQRDYDRLIFSPAFRRLQNKTQVFPLPGSVFVHNRLITVSRCRAWAVLLVIM